MRYLYILTSIFLLTACGTNIDKTTEKYTKTETTGEINGIPAVIVTETTTNLVNGEVTQVKTATATNKIEDTNNNSIKITNIEQVTEINISETTSSDNSKTKTVKTVINETKVEKETQVQQPQANTEIKTVTETTTKTLLKPETIQTTVTKNDGTKETTTTVANDIVKQETKKVIITETDSSKKSTKVTEKNTINNIQQSTDESGSTTKIIVVEEQEKTIETVIEETIDSNTGNTIKTVTETVTQTIAIPKTTKITVTEPSGAVETKTEAVANVSQTITKQVTTTTIDANTNEEITTKKEPINIYTEIGVWEYTYPAVNGAEACIETWIMRPDGSFKSTSYQETIEGSYTLDDQANSSGLFPIALSADKVTGSPDCSGNSTPEGGQAKYYIEKPTDKIDIFKAYEDATGNNLAFEFKLAG